jgi:TonB family protein
MLEVCGRKKDVMKFDMTQPRRRMLSAFLGALLMSLLLLLSASIASAQEAPRPEGSSPIKPPMIKPPMGKSQTNKGGSVRSSSRRKRALRRKRNAKKRTVRHEIVMTPAEGEQPNAEPPGGGVMVGGSEMGTGGGSPAIKPPMSNESNAALNVPPPQRRPVSGGILNGKAITLPRPAYPPIARAARAYGTVVVEIIIDEEGNVISARAVSGHPLLQAAAAQAAREAKFTPTRIEGQPVKVAGKLTYNFVL